GHRRFERRSLLSHLHSSSSIRSQVTLPRGLRSFYHAFFFFSTPVPHTAIMLRLLRLAGLAAGTIFHMATALEADFQNQGRWRAILSPTSSSNQPFQPMPMKPRRPLPLVL